MWAHFWNTISKKNENFIKDCRKLIVNYSKRGHWLSVKQKGVNW